MLVLSIRNEKVKKDKTKLSEPLELRITWCLKTGSVLETGIMINLQVLSSLTSKGRIYKSKKTKRSVQMSSKQCFRKK